MANEKYPVRLMFQSKEDYENFKKAETISIMKDANIVNVIAFNMARIVKENSHLLKGKVIVDSEALKTEASNRFGIELNRTQLMKLRENLIEGTDYFSAHNGYTNVFRYDLGKCLVKIKEQFGK